MDWCGLIHDIERALRCCDAFPSSTRVDGRLQFLDAGLNHDNYIFHLAADEPLPTAPGAFILRRAKTIPPDGAAAIDRLQTEAEMLRTLENFSTTCHAADFGSIALPELNAPRFVCLVQDADGVARSFIETMVPALPMEYIVKGADGAAVGIAAIARAAVQVHRLSTASFPFLPAYTDAQAHRAAELQVLSSASLQQDAVGVAGLGWLREHLAASRPATVLHGDLLPQNVLLDAHTRRPAVVDWEYARIGDPAYDLAIVTRGKRKLLGCGDGVRHLIDAYCQAGGIALSPADIRFWEVALHLSWLANAINRERLGERGGQPPDAHRQNLRAILRRA